MPTADQIRRYASDPTAFLAELRIPSAHGPKAFGSCMADFQQERFASITPALKAVAVGEMPPIGRHWIETTKGTSKTSDLACCLLWLLAFTSRPLTIQAAAADQDQADELRKAAKAILRLNPWLAQRVEIQQWKILCKATDSEAEVIAADCAGSHGARPDVLIIDEISHVTKDEFTANLLDNASKVPRGVVIVAGNAGFIGTQAWKWREIARTSPRWSFICYDRPAPWLSEAEIDEARRRNPTARFNRLWNGIWSSGIGDAIDPADIEAAIDRTLAPIPGSIWRMPETKPRNPLLPRMEAIPEFPPEPPPQQERRSYSFVAGLDLGIKHDHSALVVLAADHLTQRVRLAFAESWAPDTRTGKVDLELVESGVLSAHKRFGLVTVGYDPYQAELLSQRLARCSVPMKEMPFVGANLNLMATTLLEVFRSRRIDLYPHDRLVADLRRLSIVEKSYGHKLEATRDIDGHADLATALAICLPAAVELASQRYGPGSVVRLDLDPRELIGSVEGINYKDRSQSNEHRYS